MIIWRGWSGRRGMGRNSWGGVVRRVWVPRVALEPIRAVFVDETWASPKLNVGRYVYWDRVPVLVRESPVEAWGTRTQSTRSLSAALFLACNSDTSAVPGCLETGVSGGASSQSSAGVKRSVLLHTIQVLMQTPTHFLPLYCT